MFGILLWISNNPILALIIAASILLPIMEKIDNNSKIYNFGNNKEHGITKSAIVLLLLTVAIVIISIK